MLHKKLKIQSNRLMGRQQRASAKTCLNGTHLALISAYAPNSYDTEFYCVLAQAMFGLDDCQFMDRTGGSETRGQNQAMRLWASDTGMVDGGAYTLLSRIFPFFQADKRFSKLDFLFASNKLFLNIYDVTHILLLIPVLLKLLEGSLNVSLSQDAN